MPEQRIFNFHTDISKINIPDKLNNPFGGTIPEIVKIATAEFQEYIASESHKWDHDFTIQKGKMFGVLVVRKADSGYAYIGTTSGKLLGNTQCEKFVPSVLNDSEDDFFNKGMTELTEMGEIINSSQSQSTIREQTKKRKQKSLALQQRLFENYLFSNISGAHKNVIEIFKNSSQGNPPSAAGECAAPKLLQFALTHDLIPIAIAEFWWGITPKNKDRVHKGFYPACKNRCRPILEFMLDDTTLYNQAEEDQVHT